MIFTLSLKWIQTVKYHHCSFTFMLSHGMIERTRENAYLLLDSKVAIESHRQESLKSRIIIRVRKKLDEGPKQYPYFV